MVEVLASVISPDSLHHTRENFVWTPFHTILATKELGDQNSSTLFPLIRVVSGTEYVSSFLDT